MGLNRNSVSLLTFFFIGIMTLGIDQLIKSIFINGMEWHSPCLSLEVTYNRGISFSLFWGIGELKFILIGIILIVVGTMFRYGIVQRHPIITGILIGAGGSNQLDRFLHDGVVDYIHWHCLFDFPIFNIADTLIDIGIGLLLIALFQEEKKKQIEEE